MDKTRFAVLLLLSAASGAEARDCAKEASASGFRNCVVAAIAAVGCGSYEEAEVRVVDAPTTDAHREGAARGQTSAAAGRNPQAGPAAGGGTTVTRVRATASPPRSDREA